MTQMLEDIRSVVITVTNGRIVLPNAALAEVVTIAQPDPYPEQPAWVYGRIRWRGWQIPLVSFSMYAGLSHEEGQIGARVAVLKTVSGIARLPYLGLLTQGFPRLTQISTDALTPDSYTGIPQPGVQLPIRLRDEPALIPNLASLEQALTRSVLKPQAA